MISIAVRFSPNGFFIEKNNECLGKLTVTLELENVKFQSVLIKSDYNAHHYSSNMWAFFINIGSPFSQKLSKENLNLEN